MASHSSEGHFHASKDSNSHAQVPESRLKRAHQCLEWGGVELFASDDAGRTADANGIQVAAKQVGSLTRLGAAVGPTKVTSLSVGTELPALPVVVNGELGICMLRQHWRRFA